MKSTVTLKTMFLNFLQVSKETINPDPFFLGSTTEWGCRSRKLRTNKTGYLFNIFQIYVERSLIIFQLRASFILSQLISWQIPLSPKKTIKSGI